MSSNLTLSKKILSAKEKYFLMIHQELDGDFIITKDGYFPQNSVQDCQIQECKVALPELDKISSKAKGPFELINCFKVKELYCPTMLDIGYMHGNSIRNIPIMYDDETLYSILTQQSNVLTLVNEVFSNGINKIKHDSHVTARLLDSSFSITDDRIRNILIDYQQSGYHFLKTNALENLIHSSYKQWRTFYYHTTDQYIKSPKQKTLSL